MRHGTASPSISFSAGSGLDGNATLASFVSDMIDVFPAHRLDA
jgi:hypothetical protein